MNETSCMFRFNPVGQGLFYSGQIDDFTFVYDCGGKKAFVEQEIKRLPQKSLDLLIISHMHSDHVSGVKALKDHCGHIRQVVLPYLQPAEILLLIAEYLSSDDRTSEDDDFISMLLDPDEYFGGDSELSFVINKHDEERKQSESETNDFMWLGQKYGHRRSHEQSFENKLWSFRFFHEPISEQLLEQFQEALQSKDIAPYAYNIDVVQHAENLKAAYASVVGKKHLNRTSLVCLHRPLCDIVHCGDVHKCCEQQFSGGTLLTGDINFNQCIPEFKDHFSEEELGSVCWASVPHHGSRHNWHDTLFDLLENCWDWVCSCGFTNRYRHPHKKVLRAFFRNSPRLNSCTEYTSGFNYWMVI